ncbi:MAG: hypothetical protein OZ933_16010 [Chloroflexota bacterium]|nr:hypothetical protein [Chloroflexota bacterium]
MGRRTVLAAILSVSILSAGCGTPAGGVDTRFTSIPAETVIVDRYPISVKILKVNESTYDVEAGEGRFIAFTGINEPLLQQERYRRGAEQVLRRRLGSEASLTIKNEYAPAGRALMFIRYDVRPRSSAQ